MSSAHRWNAENRRNSQNTLRYLIFLSCGPVTFCKVVSQGGREDGTKKPAENEWMGVKPPHEGYPLVPRLASCAEVFAFRCDKTWGPGGPFSTIRSRSTLGELLVFLEGNRGYHRYL